MKIDAIKINSNDTSISYHAHRVKDVRCGKYWVFRQRPLDSFPILYPECEEIGDNRIFGSEIGYVLE